MAMTGCIILAIIVVNSPQVGGIEGMKANLDPSTLSFFPVIGSAADAGNVLVLSITSFLAYIGIIWRASWYPGAEPGGGGYVAQRMMSAKDEKHSLFATFFFQAAHYAIRPWTWAIAALAALILYPDLSSDEKGLGFVFAMRDFLPTGLKGLLVAAFFAAYMSTVATQLNWGTSYLINDFYRRFIRKDKDEKHYILSARITTILLMLISVLVTLMISTISGAWQFIMECGAGVGLVLILRWFWWRVNAWSEISAMITPFIVYPVLILNGISFPSTLFYLVASTTFVWIIVTFLTKPVKEKTLLNFYRKVHPGGWLWKEISRKLPDVKSDSGFPGMFLNLLLGVIMVCSFLFGTGYILFGETITSVLFFLAGILSFILIYRNLSNRGWEKII